MKTVLKSAPLAQLDRASGYEPEGREFESLRARHFSRRKQTACWNDRKVQCTILVQSVRKVSVFFVLRLQSPAMKSQLLSVRNPLGVGKHPKTAPGRSHMY